MENKRVVGNNATLGIYTDDIKKAFENAKQIGATILYESEYIQDSPYKYICFGILGFMKRFTGHKEEINLKKNTN